MLTDTHAHLYWDSFKEDFDQVITRAIDASVSIIINVGVDVEKSKLALKQVEDQLSKYAGLTAYSTIGIHPHESLRFEGKEGLEELEKEINQLEKIYQSNPEKVVAVGECGLDFAKETIKTLQRKLFQAQINLAKKLNLPLIVHCRDDRSGSTSSSPAWDEILKMVGTNPTILHCYSGLPHTTNYILQTPNFMVSFAGTLTYPKNEYLREAAKLLPLDRIILETDCPFLPPQSKRGTRNEPANIKTVAETLSQIKGASLKEIGQQTTKNVKMIFNI